MHKKKQLAWVSITSGPTPLNMRNAAPPLNMLKALRGRRGAAMRACGELMTGNN